MKIYIVFSIVCLFILMSCSEEDVPIEQKTQQNKSETIYAYVSDGSYSIGSENSLRIIDVTDPKKPQEIGFCNLPSDMSGATGIYLVGKYAYVADNHNNPDIWVIDVSEPTNPKVVGSCDTPSFAQNIYVDGGYAYVADEEAGLQVIDISDPTNPKVIGFCDTPGLAYDIYVDDRYAYVANSSCYSSDVFRTKTPSIYEAGLQVIDVSGPTSPKVVGFCDTPGNAVGVRQKDNYAYIADIEGLRVIDIRDPAKPKEVGFYASPPLSGQYVTGIWITDSFCYLAQGKGLDVIDISNPKMPKKVASCSTSLGGVLRRIYVYDGCAYLTGGEIGIIMVDISFPRKPREIGRFDTPGYAKGIYVTGTGR